MLEKSFVEIARMATKIANQVANLGPNSSIFVLDQHVQVSIYVRIVYWFIKVFMYSCKLRYQTECVNDETWTIFDAE